MISVVRILKDNKKPIILFQKNQNHIQILNFQFSVDQNDNRYLEIVAQNILDIVQYVISLDSSSIACSYQLDQYDSKQLNFFIHSYFQQNLIFTNQKFQQQKILLKNNQEIQPLPVTNSFSNNSNKVIYFSQPSNLNGQQQKSNVKLLNGEIFNNSLIENVQINSLNLLISYQQQVVLNSLSNIKRLFLYDITIKEMQAKLVIQNLELIHIKTLIFENFNQQQMNSMITKKNCSTIIIEDISFQNSIFTQGSIFNVANSTFIQIIGMKIVQSTFDKFIIMRKVQKVQIKDVNILSTTFKTDFIEQY
ncbi:hypothetical protein ABPG72_007314 [Tetrahymena utriculariae]